MTFIFKLIIFTLLFAFVVYVLKMIARLSQRVRATVTDVNKLRELFECRPQASADMVRCQNCGAFISAKEASTVSGKKTKVVYCSRECLNADVKTV